MEQGLAGNVLVTGQDADLAACQWIRRRWQTMSIYKPLARLSRTAADAAYALAARKVLIARGSVPNGFEEVPALLEEVIVVDQDNLMSMVEGRLPSQGRPAVTAEPVLEARRISKRFGGVHALNIVSVDVLPGEDHALCGENGAVKSTLMKALTGLPAAP